MSRNLRALRIPCGMLEPRLPADAEGLPLTEAALAYAEQFHEGQRRPVDGAPFIVHPLEVASLLYFAGASDAVVAAGVLHDVIEDTAAVASDLQRRFGRRVTDLVVAVSENDRIAGFDARKAALRSQVAASGRDALLLFAADKVSNARALRLALARDGAGDLTVGLGEKIRHYRRSAEMLEDLEPEAPLVHRLHTELDRLDAELAHQGCPELAR
jgi:(p)ppGpp synthase/HD superfamily hydrolase